MPIFEVIRTETTCEYCFIDAENKEQAEEIANEKEELNWRNGQKYDCNISSVKEADPDELRGRIIDTEDSHYNYNNLNKRQ